MSEQNSWLLAGDGKLNAECNRSLLPSMVTFRMSVCRYYPSLQLNVYCSKYLVLAVLSCLRVQGKVCCEHGMLSFQRQQPVHSEVSSLLAEDVNGSAATGVTLWRAL